MNNVYPLAYPHPKPQAAVSLHFIPFSFLYDHPHRLRSNKFLVIYLRGSLLSSRQYSLPTKCVKCKRKYISGFDRCLVVGGKNDVTRPRYAHNVTCIRDVMASCSTPSHYSLLYWDWGSSCVISVVQYKLNYRLEGQGGYYSRVAISLTRARGIFPAAFKGKGKGLP